MGSFVIIKRSVALFLVLFSCIYFFTTNNSNTEQVTEIQAAPSLKLETNNTESAKEITEKEILTEHKEHENILSVHAINISDSESVSERQSKSNRERGFYSSISGGKVYYDNSEIFVRGIKAIIKKAIDLIHKRYGEGWVSWIMGETLDINKLNNKIDVDFQWLGSVSLGYYARENGRVDFEIIYSKINIKDSNTTPIFDKSAGIFTFLLNFYYNPSIQNTKFAPYIGLGIGPTVFRLKKINKPNQDLMPLNVPWFAYQVKLGVDYSIIPKVKTFLGYRYFDIPVPVAEYIATHNIEVGLLFNF